VVQDPAYGTDNSVTPERTVQATNWWHPMVKRNFPHEISLLNVLRWWAPDTAA
jgi:hypothetical protein